MNNVMQKIVDHYERNEDSECPTRDLREDISKSVIFSPLKYKVNGPKTSTWGDIWTHALWIAHPTHLRSKFSDIDRSLKKLVVMLYFIHN